MSSLPKGESMGTKLIELFANRVIERRNMINDYLRERACIESVMGSLISGGVLILSFCFAFELFLLFSLFLPLFVPFVGFYGFTSSI
jgi:hypothetical protein